MEAFLEVVRGIDWDLLHKQKYELLQIIDDHEKLLGKYGGELLGLVHLIDSLQDTAAKLRIWTFPGER